MQDCARCLTPSARGHGDKAIIGSGGGIPSIAQAISGGPVAEGRKAFALNLAINFLTTRIADLRHCGFSATATSFAWYVTIVAQGSLGPVFPLVL